MIGGFQVGAFTLAFQQEGVVVDTPFALGQGDDYPGWDKKAWKKRRTQEDALGQTIEDTYKKVMGIAPTQTFVVKAKKEIKKQVVETKREFEDYSQVISWLQTQQMLVDKYINELSLQREIDDEETFLLLM
jgi:hypothetical protein